jgi:FKBP-type peptidyl-prolyl cis-trans isomerase 2
MKTKQEWIELLRKEYAFGEPDESWVEKIQHDAYMEGLNDGMKITKKTECFSDVSGGWR